MKKWILLLAFCGLVGGFHSSVKGQDLHFSQFFNSPLTTNPANTGFLPDADFRVGAHYREQWTSIPVPYKTESIYGDAQVFRDRFETGWIGLGGVILRDVAGSGNLTSSKFYLSAAYHQMLGNTGLLSAGFNTGLSSKRVDIAKFTFDNQWNGKFFDVQTPSGETFAANSMNYLDVQIGMNYAWFPSDNLYMHTGFSVQHVNKPSETFFTQTPGYSTQIAPRYIYFADAVIKVHDRLILTPTTYFSSQANATEFMLGMHANVNMSQNGEQQFIAGVYYRGSDALVPMVGYQWQNFRFTFSFDATNSALKNYNNKNGASEMYLQYNGSYQTYNGEIRQSLCPSFR